MQELQRMISIYHTGFIICLTLFCVFFAATVAQFFLFNIKKIFDMKTGRGAKKSIQKMEEINAKTGKLRQSMVGQTPSVLSPDERITYPVTAKTAIDPASSQEEKAVEHHLLEISQYDGAMETELLTSSKGAEETTLLASLRGLAETTLLTHVPQSDRAETGMLTQTKEQNSAKSQEINASRKIEFPGLFQVVKDTMWIHTEEMI